MTGRELIFSAERRHRVARHLAFWVIYTFYFYPQGIWYPETIDHLLKPAVYLEALINFSFFMPACILATYTGIYVLLPRFLQKKRYQSFLISFMMLFLVCLALNYYASEWYFVFSPHPEKETTAAGTLYLSYVNSMAAIILSGISIGLKISKNWSLQHKENLAIAKKKARTELQLHKARIHPQFLFRTLNSIHTRITADMEDTPEMVLRLSDLLSYSLYCGKGKQVPLMQEIATLHDFSYLENRQEHRTIRIQVEADGDHSGHYIPPMTILSLVTDMATWLSSAPIHTGVPLVRIVISYWQKDVLEIRATASMDGMPDPQPDWTPVTDNCAMRLEASNIPLSYRIGQIRTEQESGVWLTLAVGRDPGMNIQQKERHYESV